jgi:hypothetical protein
MAIPANVAKVVLAGNLSSGLDIWNCVVHGQLSAAINQTETDLLAEAGYEAWHTAFLGAGISGHFGNPTNLIKATATGLDVDNHALTIGEFAPSGAIPAGSGGNPLPSEVAVCVSLVTGVPGRSYRGRMFLAGVASNDSGADGLLAAGAPLIFANAALAFLEDITANFHTLVPAKAITMGVLSVRRGVITPIGSTRCGNQFDVQRRRRNGTPEVYTPST